VDGKSGKLASAQSIARVSSARFEPQYTAIPRHIGMIGRSTENWVLLLAEHRSRTEIKHLLGIRFALTNKAAQTAHLIRVVPVPQHSFYWPSSCFSTLSSYRYHLLQPHPEVLALDSVQAACHVNPSRKTTVELSAELLDGQRNFVHARRCTILDA
jgi:hypothetical protein